MRKLPVPPVPKPAKVAAVEAWRYSGYCESIGFFILAVVEVLGAHGAIWYVSVWLAATGGMHIMRDRPWGPHRQSIE